MVTQLPLELVSEILSFRPRHPVAQLIKEAWSEIRGSHMLWNSVNQPSLCWFDRRCWTVQQARHFVQTIHLWFPDHRGLFAIGRALRWLEEESDDDDGGPSSYGSWQEEMYQDYMWSQFHG